MRGKRLYAISMMWSVAAAALANPTAALAQQRSFNLPEQPASRSIPEFGRQAGVQIVAPGERLRGVRTPAIMGSYDVRDALRLLLRGTGLRIAADDGASITLAADGTVGELPQNASAPQDATVPQSGESDEQAASGPAPDIVVTGTRIRGADTPSPTTVISSERIRQEGRTSLGEVIRDIPSNFRGGQSPAIALGTGGGSVANQNITGGSALNLRGLGPDATLTLLNGKRLTYSGFANAVDISIVPIEALDRLEIVPDGASAIYGSDAVAGVANIITRRDYNGVAATLRGGTTTDGGNDEYQVTLTGGTTWTSGGFIVSYDHLNSNGLDASQREYFSGIFEPYSLLPDVNSHSGLFSGHQDVGANIELGLDAVYTNRKNVSANNFGEARNDTRIRTETFAVAPSIEFTLGGGWSLNVFGTYGTDKVRNRQELRDPDGNPLSLAEVCYCNSTKAVEAGLQGPITTLPGGPLGLAVGIGYRRNEFDFRRLIDSDRPDFGGTLTSRFVYGEFNVPLVSPDMGVTGVSRLVLNGALRHESYKNIGDVTTPKIGVIYEPVRGLALKGSWGRSFKAPTLAQQFSVGNGFLSSAIDFGGFDYLEGDNVLFIGGGNPALEPERAETWSVTGELRPAFLTGLTLEVSYFNVDYSNRVDEPIRDISVALLDPAAAQFVNLSPTTAQLQDAVNFAGPSLISLVDGDPLDAVAIVDNRFFNLASDRVRGVDVSGSYTFGLAGGSFTVRGAASWLKGRRRTLPGEPSFRTVGTVFNPPKFQSRAGVLWQKGGFDAAFFYNHTGSVVETTLTEARRTGAFDTFDLNLRYKLEGGLPALRNAEIALTVNNLFDEEPPLLLDAGFNQPNVDATNYSVLGRTISLSLTTRF